jgi:C-terminal processing protease CtpA/Prc
MVLVLILNLITPALAQQKFDSQQRDRMRDILRLIASDVKKNYYDTGMQGFDFDGRVKDADERLKKSESLGQSFNIIGWTLDGLKDSHTRFSPPGRTTRQDYGWRMSMVGDHCYVTHVHPGSDAEAKGLKPGDEILSINGNVPTRETLHTLEYIYNLLAPQAGLRLQVRSPEGQPHQLDILAKARHMKKVLDLTGDSGDGDIWDLIRESENADHMSRSECIEFKEGEIDICKMPEFNLDEAGVHDLISRARKSKSLILDLRDNPGGYVTTLERLVSGFFDHEIKIADRVGRKPNMKPQVAKERKDPFTGKLVVLIDSSSASAAELFARVMQLEKRATVIGDHSSGSVMESRFYPHRIGVDTVITFATSITDANLIMADGKSLERTGVIPDELVLPTAADLASGRDPVLSRAAEILGVKLSPEKAGKLFPYEWPKL